MTTLANDLPGTIKFTGDLVTAPCKIVSSSENINIDFGDVIENTQSMDVVRKSVIKLHNCNFKSLSGSQTQRIDVKFFGDSDSMKSELLKVSGNARGIAIRMIDSVENKLDIANNNIWFVLPIDIDKDEVISLPFNARIERNGEKLVYGNFSSTATYQIEYK